MASSIVYGAPAPVTQGPGVGSAGISVPVPDATGKGGDVSAIVPPGSAAGGHVASGGPKAIGAKSEPGAHVGTGSFGEKGMLGSAGISGSPGPRPNSIPRRRAHDDVDEYMFEIRSAEVKPCEKML